MQLFLVFRALARRPIFCAAAVLTLALALGATIAITAVVEVVLLRPLPYPRPDGLYALNATLPGPGGQPASFVLSAVEFLRMRDDVRTFAQVEALSPREMSLIVDTEPATVRAGWTSAGFLRLFGLQPVIGREYTEDEDRTRASVAILDGGYWQRRFGGDPEVVGRTILLDGKPHEIIGVTPAGYRPLLTAVDVWVPLGATIDPAQAGARLMAGVGRLAAGVTADHARDSLRQISAALARDFPRTHAQAQLRATELHEALYGPYRPALLLLVGGVLFLLMIACSNVANLALGRVAERRGEIALRLALGASPQRILREQLLEMAVITAIGGTIGLFLAFAGIALISGIYPDALPADVSAGVSGRVAALVFGQIAIAAFASGLVPAWRARSVAPHGVLAATSARLAGGRRDRQARELLLAVQIAFAVVLLCVAGVLGASLRRLTVLDPGFDAHSVITMQLAPPTRYPDVPTRAAYVERVLGAIVQLPGVVAAGTTQTTWQPLSSMQAAIEIEGQPAAPGERIMVNIRHTTPGYFDALRVGIVAGRALAAQDRLGREFVALVSESFAEHYWPGQSALGRRVRREPTPSRPPVWLTVVGVARDVMDTGLGRELGPTIYVPYLQQNTPTARVTLVVRTRTDPESVVTAIQRAIWGVDAAQPIDSVQTLDQALGHSIAQPRFRTSLISLFGVMGLVLACVGVYGVAAYAVAQRTREIGVRVAVGASTAQIERWLTRRALTPVLLGLAMGGVLAVLTTAYLRSMLEGVDAGDLVAAGFAAVLLAVCAVVATWVPARRAARLAPVDALRLG